MNQWSSFLFAAVLLGGTGMPQGATADTIHSATYPVWIHFSPGQESFAAAVLASLDDAWAFQVDQLGFPPPPADDGAFGDNDYDVLIQDEPHGAACQITVPVAERSLGYASFIQVDPGLPTFALDLILAHEFHHAIQAGIRPAGHNVMEAGAVYVSGLNCPGESENLSYFLGFNEFQAHPERSLDWQANLGNFYPYGSALFFIFLDQAYGDMETASLYQSMWDALAKPETADYFAALRTVTDLDEAYRTFARWRYFVGPADDGHHWRDMSLWEGSRADEKLESVQLTADLTGSDLPFQIDLDADGPMPYGAAYVRLSLAALSPDEVIALRFAGDPATRWSLETAALEPDAPPVHQSFAVPAGEPLTVELPRGSAQTLVLAMVNLGNETYAPDGPWSAAPCALAIDATVAQDPPAPASPGGCAAARSNPTGSSLLWWAGALVVLSWRRRRG